MGNPSRPKENDKLICLCNAVPQSKIEEAIKRGVHTLGELFDVTNAGVGPCGGSCQGQLREMIQRYRDSGKKETGMSTEGGISKQNQPRKRNLR